MRATSKGMILGTTTTIVLSILKIFAFGIVIGISWWLITLPFILVVSGLAIYVVGYMAKIFYRGRKYQRQQNSIGRK